MVQNICGEKISLDLIKASSFSVEGRKALLLELHVDDYNCFAVYLRSENERCLSVVSSKYDKAEALFKKAVEHELSPIHLDDFCLDFNREWDESV